jgi:hypothetical protein
MKKYVEFASYGEDRLRITVKVESVVSVEETLNEGTLIATNSLLTYVLEPYSVVLVKLGWK